MRHHLEQFLINCGLMGQNCVHNRKLCILSFNTFVHNSDFESTLHSYLWDFIVFIKRSLAEILVNIFQCASQKLYTIYTTPWKSY